MTEDEAGRFGAADRATHEPSPDGLGHAVSVPSAEAFREAVIDELVVCHIYNRKHDNDPKLAIHDAISWNVNVALDPRVSESARDLLDQGFADGMRDASLIAKQMCGVIGAFEGSSIHAALSACWEKMDAIAQAIEARSGETRQGLDPEDESAVLQDAPEHYSQPSTNTGEGG